MKPKLGLERFTGLVGAATNTMPKPSDEEVVISSIIIKPQVRKQFNQEKLEQLAASIRDQGVIEPVVLLERPDGTRELICGERRILASIIAGKEKIPAVIKRDLTDVQIRKMQIAENKESDDLTAFDEAMGVVEDVDKYGVPETMVIWNRSEGWVSKRVAVAKYPPQVRQLLEQGTCGDFEILGPLNVLYGLDVAEFDHMHKRLLNGPALSRDELRNKIANVKTYQRDQKQLAKAQKTKAPVAALNQAPTKGREGAAAPALALVSSSGRAAEETETTAVDTVRQNAETRPAVDREHKQRQALETHFRKLLIDIYDAADANRSYFVDLNSDLEKLKCDMNQTDWAMWSGFQTVLLPVLEALGPERSARYLKQLVFMTKAKAPMEIWNDLHPALDGTDRPGAPRQEVAVMPDNWRF